MAQEWRHPGNFPVPCMTVDQARRVERFMVDELGIDPLQPLALAGRHLAEVARIVLPRGALPGSRVLVLAGSGRNGAGVMVAARRLYGWGARVRVVTSRDPEGIRGEAGRQLGVLRAARIPIAHWAEASPLRTPQLILDGVIGLGLSGPPHDGVAAMIGWVNGVSATVVSLDVPSGLDAETGEPLDPTVLAAATLTVGLPKRGLCEAAARPYVGDLYLGDLGVPAEAYEAVGVSVGRLPLFTDGDLVRLT